MHEMNLHSVPLPAPNAVKSRIHVSSVYALAEFQTAVMNVMNKAQRQASTGFKEDIHLFVGLTWKNIKDWTIAIWREEDL